MRSAAVRASTVETRPQREPAAHAVAGTSRRMRRGAGRASTSEPGQHERRAGDGDGAGALGEDEHAEQRRGERLGERQRRGLPRRQVAQAAREEHVGERGRHGAEEHGHGQAVAAAQPAQVAGRQHGHEQQRAERERRRHHPLGSVAAPQQPLREDGVGRVAGAGGHGQDDPERIGGGAAAAEHEREHADARRAPSRPPSGAPSGSPSTIRPITPAIAGAEPSATTVPTATPVRSTAAKNDTW